jgi:exonuclease SbcD
MVLRVIHTSDWHLGQLFKGHERTAEHRVFLFWLLDALVERDVDALIIAGDVFDQASPSAEAQKLFFAFLAAANQRKPGLRVVVVAGNHDSPSRLQAPAAVLDCIDVHVVGRHCVRESESTDHARLLVPLAGKTGDVEAWVLAMPFLRPADMARAPGQSHAEAIGRAYALAVEFAREHRRPNQALILTGHLHLAGGDVSADSERRIIIGDEEAVDATMLPAEASYVALGHLHRPQRVGSEHVRYSGSPLPLSFSEIHYPHQVVQIDFNAGSVAAITPVRVPRPALMLRVPERPAPLEEVLQALRELVVDAASEPGLEPLLEVQLQAAIVPTDLRQQVEQALGTKRVRLAGINRTRPPRQVLEGGESVEKSALGLGELKPELLFDRLLAEQQDVADTASLRDAFQQLLDQVQQEAR